MKLHYHAAFSVTISGILYVIFKSWGLTFGCLIAGIFIDLDHIYDYVREHGRPFHIKNFFHMNHTAQYNRIVLFWHGWEWVGIWGITAWISDWSPWITGGLVGFTLHIVLDAVQNGSNLQCYSLIWRWTRGFEFDTTFPKLKDLKYKNR